jgi:hypothetical protein
VEVKIGVQHAAREIVLESAQSTEDVRAAVNAAIADREGVLSLEDDHGRLVIVPSERLAYVEIGEPTVRRVGFGAM